MPKYFLFFLLFSISAFSQRTITGTICDTLNSPLESANVIAKPLQEKSLRAYQKKKAEDEKEVTF